MVNLGDNEKFTYTKGDYIHLTLLALLLLYTAYAIFSSAIPCPSGHFFQDLQLAFKCAGINEIFTLIGALAFVLFGVMGIYDFAYSYHLWLLVPPYYRHLKRESMKRDAEAMMRTYYETDMEFIQQYEQERVRYVLQALGVDETQFHKISYDLVRARVMPVGNLKALRKKAETYLYGGDFVEDLTSQPNSCRVYENVNYFINLYAAMYSPEICSDIAHIMADYVLEVLAKRQKEIANIDYFVIPKGGNLLLGLEVGKILRKPVIAIQEQERIYRNKWWDGKYQRNHMNKIIILHDVLVTGKIIADALQKLPPGSYAVEGLYCLVRYHHQRFDPEGVLKKKLTRKQIHCLIDVCEDQLKKYARPPRKEDLP